MANSLPPFHQYILNFPKSPVYGLGFDAPLSPTTVHWNIQFLGIPSFDFKSASPTVINNLFSDL